MRNQILMLTSISVLGQIQDYIESLSALKVTVNSLILRVRKQLSLHKTLGYERLKFHVSFHVVKKLSDRIQDLFLLYNNRGRATCFNFSFRMFEARVTFDFVCSGMVKSHLCWFFVYS